MIGGSIPFRKIWYQSIWLPSKPTSTISDIPSTLITDLLSDSMFQGICLSNPSLDSWSPCYLMNPVQKMWKFTHFLLCETTLLPILDPWPSTNICNRILACRIISKIMWSGQSTYLSLTQQGILLVRLWTCPKDGFLVHHTHGVSLLGTVSRNSYDPRFYLRWFFLWSDWFVLDMEHHFRAKRITIANIDFVQAHLWNQKRRPYRQTWEDKEVLQKFPSQGMVGSGGCQWWSGYVHWDRV